MRISIVIPLYNKAPYIRRALDSIASQTFSDFEVIVVDDGSTDGGGRIVADYPDARFRLIAQPNAGPGPARNRALAEAQGEFIAFLDADDEWLPQFLEESMLLLDGYGTDVASITSCYLEEPSGISREKMWRARGIMDGVHRLETNTAPFLAVQMLAYMSPCSTMVRGEVIRKWGGFYSRGKCLFGEDAFLWLKVLLNEKVAFNLHPLVRFHTEASGLSKNLEGARPVEPFLIDPKEIEAVCPPHLRHLLARILAIRAFKTACVLGYWGHWREAKSLLKRYATPDAWHLPYYMPGLVCCTPLGGGLGKTWRALRSVKPPATERRKGI